MNGEHHEVGERPTAVATRPSVSGHGDSADMVRVAFYGRTNAAGDLAALILGGQFRICQMFLKGRGVLTRFFYDISHDIDERMVVAVREGGGPAHRDGGWNELAGALRDTERGFDVIVCESIDRISRRTPQLLQRENLAASHAVTILCSDEPWPEQFLEPSVTSWMRDRLVARGW